jgi:hypothetical protein
MDLINKDGTLSRAKVTTEARKITDVVLFNSTAVTEQRIVDLVEEAYCNGVNVGQRYL